MGRFSGPEGIYDKLVENVPEDEEWLHGLVAFAVIEEQKIEWIKHESENNGSPPSNDDIENWYQRQPQGVLLRARDTASARLDDYVKVAIEDQIANFQKQAEEDIIVGEIREIKKFWPQFGVNLAGGFAATLLFAALLIIVALSIHYDASPVEIITSLEDHIEEISNE